MVTMGAVTLSEPNVLCAAPCGKTPVHAQFYDCFNNLEVPGDKRRVLGGSVVGNLNKIANKAVDEGYTHVFIVEDDSEFESDAVMRLLAHDKPVVTGLCRSRQAPFKPYIYKGLNEDGLVWRPLTSEDTGLIKVAATGMGGILINTEVFAKLKRPYFQTFYEGEREWGQDIYFGKTLIDAGIDVYCDLDVHIGHASMVVIGSERDDDGEWIITMTVNDATIKTRFE